MKTVHVIGPVVRGSDPDLSQAATLYDKIRETLSAAGIRVILPSSEPFLEMASPEEFFAAMAARIGSSDLIITVLPENNPSGGIESAMASFMEKDQYVIVQNVESTPRLLRGLPGVQEIVSVNSASRMLSEVKHRFRENLNPPMTLSR